MSWKSWNDDKNLVWRFASDKIKVAVMGGLRKTGTSRYDFFVSYARADNADEWITAFVNALLEEHRRLTR